jgi:hypothetical protein
MPTDPIQQVIAVLTDPTTGLFTLPAGTGPVGQGPLYSNVEPFVNAIFSTSQLQSVSQQINTALAEAATVVGAIASAMSGIGGTIGNVPAAMTALQNALSLAQSLAPAGTAAVLTSGSTLFQTIQTQLSDLGSTTAPAQAAQELTNLQRLLTGLAAMFPT